MLKHSLNTALFLVLFFVFFACNKRKKDTVNTDTVSGHVTNIYTDKGEANQTVLLTINGIGNKTLSTQTDALGNFSFAEVEIHSSDEFSYFVYIPDVNGDCRLKGSIQSFTKDNYRSAFQLTVGPELGYFTLVIAGMSPPTAGDSLIMLCEQRTAKKNDPLVISYLRKKSWADGSPAESHRHLPMGRWHVRIDKWLNNVPTTVIDSIDFSYGESKTYGTTW